jgi:two-component sensor histidine kinase
MAVDGVPSLSAIVTDMTERKRAEETAMAERFTRSIVDQLTDPVVVCDQHGRISNVSAAAKRLAVVPPVGCLLGEAFPIVADDGGAPESARRAVADAVVAAAMSGRPVHSLEVLLATGAADGAHFLLSAGPFLDSRGQTVGCIVALTDITPRRRAEEQHRVLLAELNHRVKNNLAIVRSVATQTMSSSSGGSLATFQKAFDGRLSALALAHDILTQTGWQHADLETLIEQVISPYRTGGSQDRIDVRGPALQVPPQFVLPLAIVFHELATNAAKYGALSVSAGRVTIAWKSNARGEEPDIALIWRETQGPEVHTPTRDGFGSTLIRRTMAYELDGEALLEYCRDGLVCTIRFPLRRNSTGILGEAVRAAGPLG